MTYAFYLYWDWAALYSKKYLKRSSYRCFDMKRQKENKFLTSLSKCYEEISSKQEAVLVNFLFNDPPCLWQISFSHKSLPKVSHSRFGDKQQCSRNSEANATSRGEQLGRRNVNRSLINQSFFSDRWHASLHILSETSHQTLCYLLVSSNSISPFTFRLLWKWNYWVETSACNATNKMIRRDFWQIFLDYFRRRREKSN